MTFEPLPKVIAVGAIHADTIAHARETIRRETSTPAHLSARPGGVATNAARVLARLGTDVRLIGVLGADAAGAQIAELLAREGIGLDAVRRDGFPTGQYLALHDPDGSLAAACVDDRVLAEAPADVLDAPLARALQGAGDGRLCLVDANLPQALLLRIAERFPEARLIANAVSEAKAPRLAPLLPRLDALLLNLGEARALTGLGADAGAERLCAALADAGLNRFVLTQGAGPVWLGEGGALRRTQPRQTGIVDVTGAGDALCAGVLAAMARGQALRTALPFGLAAAELTLAATGALADTMSWTALQQRAGAFASLGG